MFMKLKQDETFEVVYRDADINKFYPAGTIFYGDTYHGPESFYVFLDEDGDGEIWIDLHLLERVDQGFVSDWNKVVGD